LQNSQGKAPSSRPPAGSHDRLNPRELEVLAGIARGKRNRQIAEEPALTKHTVKVHVRKILGKPEVTSRGEAAVLARELRLESVSA